MTAPVNLNYQESGTGAPVVLMHGMFGSLSNLGLLSRTLAEDYRVISVDMRNHGESPHSDAMSYPLMAQDIELLLSSLGIEQAHFVGHSMGGKVAMQLALSHPDIVNKVVIADIAPVTYSPNRHDDVLDGLSALEQAALTSRREADELLSQFVDEPGIRAFLLKNLARGADQQLHLKLNLRGLIANYFDELTLAPTGESFVGPILFLKGSESAYIQEKHRDTINQLFPNARLKVINGTGHWLHAEKPAIFNRIVQDFLNQ